MNRTFKVLLSGVILGMLSLTSCIKEDNSDCPRPFSIYLKALDADDKDITANGDVKNAVVFIINDQGDVIKTLKMTEEQIKSRVPIEVEFQYGQKGSVRVSAWGNINEQIGFPNPASIKHVDEIKATLKSAGEGLSMQPSDLFQGEIVAPIVTGGLEPSGNHVVEIRRKTAQVSMTAVGLKQWNSNKEGKYSFILRKVQSLYDNKGAFGGTETGISVDGTTDADGVMTKTGLFRAFPPKNSEAYVVDILFNGTVIHSASVGKDGKPFVPTLGKVLNIVIDFYSSISVSVVITDWDEVYQHIILGNK
ncbi:FimB/Mfa2 family fimbrial subunit [Porphyromonas sp.]|uniref:FimB/Mfa2 family fimbrial subunit n=1 Tax=Porphyromonas sp. TaxID=1924944 RepID=UPI0026DBDC3C|nr:FimB/Mfa2 family fimbrial subunit [Porphyromonas sp.]MDO4695661.1 FimB/Mfa2 family fimbrial subunit [Porphyromonas sp.]MDO4770318.1 FimB/Mfa2 family fimbrial subunit [Porphyromonas sp.]